MSGNRRETSRLKIQSPKCCGWFPLLSLAMQRGLFFPFGALCLRTPLPLHTMLHESTLVTFLLWGQALYFLNFRKRHSGGTQMKGG